jgi:hypothetical protein
MPSVQNPTQAMVLRIAGGGGGGSSLPTDGSPSLILNFLGNEGYSTLDLNFVSSSYVSNTPDPLMPDINTGTYYIWSP